VSHAAKILAHSISPDGVPLTTFEVTFPRPILAEFNTHRMFSRNSASSRAIPVEKMIKMVLEHPYIPTHWGKNQKGMQADQEVDEVDQFKAQRRWLEARQLAVNMARELIDIGIHKQITNRLLEPFMWHTCIVTATEWDNFFHLRDNKDAHPEIQKIAHMMRELYESSEPKERDYGEWHLPLIDTDTDVDVCRTMRAGRSLDECRQVLAKISVARCARVSYLTHEGKRDIQADLDLHDKLLTSGHLSPFEHVARPAKVLVGNTLNEDATRGVFDKNAFWCGNFRGWIQLRKLIPNEADILGAVG
jgi:thymidylate synthase ThyX